MERYSRDCVGQKEVQHTVFAFEIYNIVGNSYRCVSKVKNQYRSELGSSIK